MTSQLDVSVVDAALEPNAELDGELELRIAPGAQPTIVNNPAARPAFPRSFIAWRRSIIRVSRSNANP